MPVPWLHYLLVSPQLICCCPLLSVAPTEQFVPSPLVLPLLWTLLLVWQIFRSFFSAPIPSLLDFRVTQSSLLCCCPLVGASPLLHLFSLVYFFVSLTCSCSSDPPVSSFFMPNQPGFFAFSFFCLCVLCNFMETLLLTCDLYSRPIPS